MTDRINAFVVVLDQNIRDDDVEPIANALRMVKHVQSVKPNVANVLDDSVARSRVNRWWQDKLCDLMQEAGE